jgi:RNA polymerase sigma factor (TIGR02999 family)
VSTSLKVEDLVELSYGLLKAAARRERRQWPQLVDPSTTELVHSAYLRLAHQQAWNSRTEFMAAAANTMRQVLVDDARRRLAAKRGSGARHEPLESAEHVADDSDRRLLGLDEALSRLQALEPRLAQIVEFRYFVGLSNEETGAALGITERTVRRDWLKARAWLSAHWDADM